MNDKVIPTLKQTLVTKAIATKFQNKNSLRKQPQKLFFTELLIC